MDKKPYCIACAVMLSFFMFQPVVCHAVTPYDNWALPDGSLFSAYPLYYASSKFKDNNGDTSVTDLGSRVYQATVRITSYNRSLLGNTLGFTVMAPAGRKDLLNDHDSGIGDVTMGLGYWLIDDPASRTYIVAGGYVDIPTGDYDKTKAANMGKNVWKYRPAIGAARQIGKFDIELSLLYNRYTENTATGIREGDEMIFESYIGYYMQPDLMLGSMVNCTFGEDKTFNGNRIPDSGVRRFQAGPSLYWKTGGSLSVTLSALSEFGVRNSSEGHMILSRFSWRL